MALRALCPSPVWQIQRGQGICPRTQLCTGELASKTKWTTTPKDAEFSINKRSAGLSQWCKLTLKELDSLSRRARSTKQQQDWEARLPCPGVLPCVSISADFRRASAQRGSLHGSDSLLGGALEAFKENTLNNNKKILWHIKNWAEGPSVKMDKSKDWFHLQRVKWPHSARRASRSSLQGHCTAIWLLSLFLSLVQWGHWSHTDPSPSATKVEILGDDCQFSVVPCFFLGGLLLTCFPLVQVTQISSWSFSQRKYFHRALTNKEETW